MNEFYIRNVLEAALLAAGKPLQLAEMSQLFEDTTRPKAEDIRAALDALANEYSNRGVEVKETAAGFRIQVRREFSGEVSRLWPERPVKYSRALLETLALIAYRQPITRAEIEAVRGVAVNPNIIKTVIERNWVRVVGHRDVPGRPELLGTTREFLDYFGLRSLDELPALADIKTLGEYNPQLELPGGGAPGLEGPPAGDGLSADAADGADVGVAGVVVAGLLTSDAAVADGVASEVVPSAAESSDAIASDSGGSESVVSDAVASQTEGSESDVSDAGTSRTESVESVVSDAGASQTEGFESVVSDAVASQTEGSGSDVSDVVASQTGGSESDVSDVVASQPGGSESDVSGAGAPQPGSSDYVISDTVASSSVSLGSVASDAADAADSDAVGSDAAASGAMVSDASAPGAVVSDAVASHAVASGVNGSDADGSGAREKDPPAVDVVGVADRFAEGPAASEASTMADSAKTDEVAAEGPMGVGRRNADRDNEAEVERTLAAGEDSEYHAAAETDDAEASANADSSESLDALDDSADDDADEDELSADGHGSRELVAGPRDLDH